MLFTVAIIVLRIPAEWLSALAQFNTPDSLVTALWIALSGLATTVIALAAYIRALLAEIRQMDKEHHAQLLSLAEKVLTANLETREAMKDNTEAIKVMGKQERNRARNPRSSKTP
jgi:hypothetical protein